MRSNWRNRLSLLSSKRNSLILPAQASATAGPCLLCNNLVDRFFDGGVGAPLSSKDIERNAPNCRFCKVLTAVWYSCTDDNPHQVGELQVRNDFPGIGVVITVWHDVPDPEGRVKKRVSRRRLFTSPDADTVRRNFPLQLSIRKHVASELSMPEYASKIIRWLQECQEKHPKCFEIQARSESMGGPTRLLYVSSDPNESIRIIENPPRNTQYVALSYCWGLKTINGAQQAEIATERKSSIFQIVESRLEMGLHPSDKTLPLTYRQCIAITRSIGLNHVWIDALCIKQTDRSDWSREMVKMKDIYAGACLVLSADQGASNDSGFLSPRQIPTTELRSVVPYGPVDDLNHWRVCDSQEEALWDDQYFDDQEMIHQCFMKRGFTLTDRLLHSNPVFSRGWCLQEQLLASRVVHFTNTEMVWECIEDTRCECEGLNQENHETSPSLWKKGAPQKSRWHALYESGNHGAVWMGWWDCVKQYTSRRLSVPTDILVAISGLAQRMPRQVLGNYALGLWDTTILHDLLWIAANKRAREPTRDFIAPSWSWASVSAPIIPPSWLSLMIAQLVRIDYHPGWGIDNNRAALVAGVTLNAPLLQVHLPSVYPASDSKQGYFVTPCQAVPSQKFENQRNPPPGTKIAYLIWDHLPSSTLWKFKSNVVSMDLTLAIIGAVYFVKDRSVLRHSALALKAVEARPGFYERVGFVSVGGNGVDKLWPPPEALPLNEITIV